MQRIHQLFIMILLVWGTLVAGVLTFQPAHAESRHIGINVLLNQAVTDALLADLGTHGQVLDVIPEIKAVMLNAEESELPVIQALSYVAGANPDRECSLAQSGGGLPLTEFANGANQWSLDAINVTDFGGGRTVPYDGTGVYVAVIDTGLATNWRGYFPEQRIATQFARSFGGGGGEKGTVSEQPEKWEHDTISHGTAVTSVILGFQYSGPEALPTNFNGVAPKATVIPVKVTDRSPSRTNPAIVGSRFHAFALTDRREVVSHTRAPLPTYTSGVQCGPRGVMVATAQNWPRSKTSCTAVDRKLT